jgi:hypothetical protein
MSVFYKVCYSEFVGGRMSIRLIYFVESSLRGGKCEVLGE